MALKIADWTLGEGLNSLIDVISAVKWTKVSIKKYKNIIGSLSERLAD